MEKSPRVLLVYYSHTQQAKRVADVVIEVLQARGYDVSQASIEFTDPRYVEKFSRFPFKHAVFDLLAVLPGRRSERRAGSGRYWSINMREVKKLATKPRRSTAPCRSGARRSKAA